MEFDRKTEKFIEATCKKMYRVKSYNVFVKKLTDLVDEYGRKHGLNEDTMDAIQNEIFIRLGR